MNNFTFNIFEMDWTATGTLVAILISLISAIIAGMVRQDSNKSARESEKARKIAQADLLAPHFHNIEYLSYGALLAGRGSADSQKVNMAYDSAQFISFAIDNPKLHELISKLFESYKSYQTVTSAQIMYSDGEQMIANAHDEILKTAKEIEQITHQYLKIG